MSKRHAATVALNDAESDLAKARARCDDATRAHAHLIEQLRGLHEQLERSRQRALNARTPADRFAEIEQMGQLEKALAEVDGPDAHRVRSEHGTAQAELEKAKVAHERARAAFERAVAA